MDRITNENDEAEEGIFTDEILDEALERAADTRTEKGENYTFCACTYMKMCRFW